MSKLGNPIVAATVITKSAEAIPFLIKFGAVLVVGYVVYNSYTNRFVKWKENSSYAQSNISYAQAVAKADSIAKSKGVLSNDFDNVASQITNLNYNGFVRVYNAFGQQTGTYLTGRNLNLIEWFYNQYNSHQIQQLSFLLGGAFF